MLIYFFGLWEGVLAVLQDAIVDDADARHRDRGGYILANHGAVGIGSFHAKRLPSLREKWRFA